MPDFLEFPDIVKRRANRFKAINPSSFTLSDNTVVQEPFLLDGVPLSEMFPITWNSANGVYQFSYGKDTFRYADFHRLQLPVTIHPSVSLSSIALNSDGTMSGTISNVILLSLGEALAAALTAYTVMSFPGSTYIPVAVSKIMQWLVIDTGRPYLKQLAPQSVIRFMLLFYVLGAGETDKGRFMFYPDSVPDNMTEFVGTPAQAMAATYNNFRNVKPKFELHLKDSLAIDLSINNSTDPAGGYSTYAHRDDDQVIVTQLQIPFYDQDWDVAGSLYNSGSSYAIYLSQWVSTQGDPLIVTYNKMNVPVDDTVICRLMNAQSSQFEVRFVWTDGVGLYINPVWGTSANYRPVIMEPNNGGNTVTIHEAIDTPTLRKGQFVRSGISQSAFTSGMTSDPITIGEYVPFTAFWIQAIMELFSDDDSRDLDDLVKQYATVYNMDPVMMREVGKNITANMLIQTADKARQIESTISDAIISGETDLNDLVLEDQSIDKTQILNLSLPKISVAAGSIDSSALDSEVTLGESIEAINLYDNVISVNMPDYAIIKDQINSGEILGSDLIPVFNYQTGNVENMTVTEFNDYYNFVQGLELQADVYNDRIRSLVNQQKQSTANLLKQQVDSSMLESMDDMLINLISMDVTDPLTIQNELLKIGERSKSSLRSSLPEVTSSLGELSFSDIELDVDAIIENNLSTCISVFQNASRDVNGKITSIASAAMSKLNSFARTVSNATDPSKWFGDGTTEIFGMQAYDVFAPMSAAELAAAGLSTAIATGQTTLQVIGALMKNLAKRGWDAVNKVVSTAGGSVKSVVTRPYGLSTLSVAASKTFITKDDFNTQYSNLYQALGIGASDGAIRVIRFGKNYYFIQPIGDVVHIGVNPAIEPGDPEYLSDDYQFATLMVNSMLAGIYEINDIFTTFNNVFADLVYGTFTLIPVPSREDLLSIALRNVEYQSKAKDEIDTASVIIGGVGIALMIGAAIAFSALTFGIGAGIAAVAVTALLINDWSQEDEVTLQTKLEAMEDNPELANQITSGDMVDMWQSYIPEGAIIDMISIFDWYASQGYVHDGNGEIHQSIKTDDTLGFIPFVTFSGSPRYRYSLLTSQQEAAVQLAAIATVIGAVIAMACVSMKITRRVKIKRKSFDNRKKMYEWKQVSDKRPDGSLKSQAELLKDQKTADKLWRKLQKREMRYERVLSANDVVSSGGRASLISLAAPALLGMPEQSAINAVVDNVSDKQDTTLIDLAVVKTRIG